MVHLEPDGSLVIDLAPLAPRMRVLPWGAGMEVLAGEPEAPHRATGGVVLVCDFTRAAPGNALAEFLTAIPEDARERADACGAHQLTALRLLARHAAARELAEVPSFLWLVAARLDDEARLGRPLDDDAIAALLGRRRRALLSWAAKCDVPEAAVQLLRRCTFRRPNAISRRMLLRVLADPARRRALAHVHTISVEQVRAVSMYRECLERAWVRDAVRLTGASRPMAIAEARASHARILALGRQLKIRNAAQQVARVRSLASLAKLEFAWQMRWDERRILEELREASREPLPEPMLAGCETIVPITTVDGLFEEARTMRHCLVTHLLSVVSGDLFLYRVLAPVRATLGIMKNRQIFDLKGRGNTEVPPECAYAVDEWMRHAPYA